MPVSILLNGHPQAVTTDLTLDGLLDEFSLPHQRIAIELNGVVIRRVDWPTTRVHNEDKIEVVHFVGGG